MERQHLFRLTAYHKEKDVSIIIDGHDACDDRGMFTRVFQSLGFTALYLDNISRVKHSSFPCDDYYPKKVVLRAIAKGEPHVNRSTISVGDKSYTL